MTTSAHEELLKAAKAVLADCENEFMDISQSLDRLEKAIARAEGKCK